MLVGTEPERSLYARDLCQFKGKSGESMGPSKNCLCRLSSVVDETYTSWRDLRNPSESGIAPVRLFELTSLEMGDRQVRIRFLAFFNLL